MACNDKAGDGDNVMQEIAVEGEDSFLSFPYFLIVSIVSNWSYCLFGGYVSPRNVRFAGQSLRMTS